MPDTRSRSIILREAEFLELLRAAPVVGEIGRWVQAIVREQDTLGDAAVVGRLGDAAHSLETFLDDYGARQNRAFATFGELVACLRGLATIKSTSLHLRSRLARYQRLVPEDELLTDLARADAVLDRSIRALAGEILSIGATMLFPWSGLSSPSREVALQRRLLPRDLDADEVSDERHHIAQIGSRYLAVLEASRNLDLRSVRPVSELVDYASRRATEERCRWYESSVHNIQSMYDTYVQGTAIEREQPWMACLRGHASVALHLLEMATGFIHFYERHENDVRHAPTRQVIAGLVSKEDVLQVAVNCCLRRAYLYIEAGAELAARFVSAFSPQACVDLVLPEGVTLHARPLALIVQVVKRYGMPVQLDFDGEKCAGNSLMGLIMLCGSHPRPSRIQARGDARALSDLQHLFVEGLGETGPLPEQLAYLGR